jgi:hypothetical protein
MATAAVGALVVDFVSKAVVVAVQPSGLLFNVSMRSPLGLGESLIFVFAACSLLACVLPSRVVALGAGVAFGGALGNLTSRHWWGARGGSPDFIRFADGSVGNLADIFIFVGGLVMAVGALLWLGWTVVGAHRAAVLARADSV